MGARSGPTLFGAEEVVHRNFDPTAAGSWTIDDIRPARKAFAAGAQYAEIDADVNAAINEIEEEAGITAAWRAISLGGPVEPLFASVEWNGLLIVGKAPGDAEVAHGEPFTGPSGRLLDKLLAHQGIVRAACMMTNVFRMQASWTMSAEGAKRANDISRFFTTDASLGDTRLPPYQNQYVLKGPGEHVRELRQLIRDYPPKAIVALGSAAAWALTGDGSLADRVGEAVVADCSDAPVVITHHPAYALHKKDEQVAAEISEHLGIAARIAAGVPAGGPAA